MGLPGTAAGPARAFDRETAMTKLTRKIVRECQFVKDGGRPLVITLYPTDHIQVGVKGTGRHWSASADVVMGLLRHYGHHWRTEVDPTC